MEILDNPPDWRIYPEELARRSTDGIKAVRSALKELEEQGYLISIRKMGSGNHGSEYFRFVADMKFPDFSKEHFDAQIGDAQIGDVQNGDVQNGDVQNGDVQNGDVQNGTLINNN